MSSYQYFTDEEYERAFIEFGGLRARLAERLSQIYPLDEGLILDIFSGHGLLSAEIAQRFPSARIVGVGLANDVDAWKRVQNSGRYEDSIWSYFQYLCCNASSIPLKTSSCDLVVNFLGLDDLYMTMGEKGIEDTVSEIQRVTKQNAMVQISLVEYGETPEEVLTKNVWDSIGLGAVFLQKEDYLEYFIDIGMHLVEDFTMSYEMKMTKNQAKEELKFACEEAPKIFSAFGVNAVRFEDIWDKFGERIEEHGLVYWSNIQVMILRKST